MMHARAVGDLRAHGRRVEAEVSGRMSPNRTVAPGLEDRVQRRDERERAS